MAVFTKFNVWPLDQATAVHNLNTAALKVMLSNSAPALANTVKSDIVQIAAGNGYVTDGNLVGFTSGAQTAGVYKLIVPVVDFIATGGDIAAFRYPVLYNSTNSKLIGFWDYAAAVIITSGNKFRLDTDQVNGILQIG